MGTNESLGDQAFFVGADVPTLPAKPRFRCPIKHHLMDETQDNVLDQAYSMEQFWKYCTASKPWDHDNSARKETSGVAHPQARTKSNEQLTGNSPLSSRSFQPVCGSKAATSDW